MEIKEKNTAVVGSSEDLTKYGYKQELDRTMNVWQLTAFGLNYMVPIAPAIIFGVLLQISGGTVALPYILAGIVMLFTAFSYAIMVRNFPLSGSVYSYVGRGLNKHLGFIAGWVLTLDYILVPTVTAASSAYFAQLYFPEVPYWVLLAIFSVGMGLLNLFGVEIMSKLGLALLILGELVVWISILVWGNAVSEGMGTGTLVSSKPFEFSSFSSLIAATSLAVFSFLGFDAITTLAEETKKPKRDIPRAIYWCVGIGTLTMAAIGYFGMLLVPDWKTHINDENWVNTVLFQVSEMTGGKAFGIFFTAGYLTELAVFNVVATAAGARLLYGMGRDNLLPQAIFAKVNKRWKTPHWSILIIVSIEFIFGLTFNLTTLSNLVTFGALFGFAALNLSVIWLYYVKKKGESPINLGSFSNWRPTGIRHFRYFIMPFIGFLFISYLWINMDKLSLIIGIIWLTIGTGFLLFKTRGFRKLPPHLKID